MSLSKDLTDSFKEGMERSCFDVDLNFSVTVLSINSWPLSLPNDGFIVPADIRLIYDHFRIYYQTTHPGRKLMWLWNHSKNELRTNYLDQKYIR
jgi:cullin 1